MKGGRFGGSVCEQVLRHNGRLRASSGGGFGVRRIHDIPATPELRDYITYARLLKSPIKKLAQSILATGVDVVMDFPANTISQREWFRQIYSEIGAPHSLFYLEVSDDVFLRQIAKRRLEQPNRLKTDTAEMFEAVTKFFVAPSFEEGLNVIKTI